MKNSREGPRCGRHLGRPLGCCHLVRLVCRRIIRLPAWDRGAHLERHCSRLVRGRLAADAEASAFLVRVAEGFEGEIEPSRSISCSREPVISKLFFANRRRRTSLLSPESSMRWSIS